MLVWSQPGQRCSRGTGGAAGNAQGERAVPTGGEARQVSQWQDHSHAWAGPVCQRGAHCLS